MYKVKINPFIPTLLFVISFILLYTSVVLTVQLILKIINLQIDFGELVSACIYTIFIYFIFYLTTKQLLITPLSLFIDKEQIVLRNFLFFNKVIIKRKDFSSLTKSYLSFVKGGTIDTFIIKTKKGKEYTLTKHLYFHWDDIFENFVKYGYRTT